MNNTYNESLVSTASDKAMPKADQAERSFLGSILLDKDAAKKVVGIVSVSDFYRDYNQIVYEAIVELLNEDQPIDMTTVATKLHSKKQLSNIGGPEYLAELQNEVPVSTHVFQYAQIIKHRSTLRRIIRAGEEITSLGYDEGKTAEELLEIVGKKIRTISGRITKERPTMMELHEKFEADKEIKRISTGISMLDKWTGGGIKAGKFVVLNAFSGVGKTTLAMQIMEHMLNAGRKINFYSIEMEESEVYGYLHRLLGGYDKMDLDKVHCDWKLNFSRTRDLDQMLAEAERDNPDIVFIDYLQMVSIKNAGSGGIYDRISEVAYRIQAFTRDTGIPVFSLSQVSNDQEGKTTGIMHAKGGGEVYASSDIFIGIRRDYEKERDTKAHATSYTGNCVTRQVHLYKNRQGMEGAFEMDWDYKVGKYVI